MLRIQELRGLLFGNSGGKDSATVIAMAQKAIGEDRVLTIAMPCDSKEEELADAKLVAKTFGTKFLTVDLSESFHDLKNEINRRLEHKELDKEALINMKPRLRMATLYGIAQTLGYLVIRHRQPLRKNGSDILPNGETVVLILIQLRTLQRKK